MWGKKRSPSDEIPDSRTMHSFSMLHISPRLPSCSPSFGFGGGSDLLIFFLSLGKRKWVAPSNKDSSRSVYPRHIPPTPQATRKEELGRLYSNGMRRRSRYSGTGFNRFRSLFFEPNNWDHVGRSLGRPGKKQVALFFLPTTRNDARAVGTSFPKDKQENDAAEALIKLSSLELTLSRHAF